MKKRSKEIDDFLNRNLIINKDEIEKSKITSNKKIKLKKEFHYLSQDNYSHMRLDLHHLGEIDAEIKLTEFIDNCITQEESQALIIFGKGKHSPREIGPIIKDMVLKKLRYDFKSYISKTEMPSDRLGGSGAVLVYFK